MLSCYFCGTIKAESWATLTTYEGEILGTVCNVCGEKADSDALTTDEYFDDQGDWIGWKFPLPK